MSNVEPKVSLITPCYNGASHLAYFLRSLEQQTYKNIEFIFINDGSTDNTEEIFNHFKPVLENKGWNVKYIYQENKGQASALNVGLKIFTGEFLIFPDSDDILYPFHIYEKVKFMISHPEYGFSFCKLDVVKESNIEKVIYTACRQQSEEDNLFFDLIERKNILWMPIGGIFRVSCFLKAIPDRDIYIGTGGQNFQMLLPMAHKFKCGYIDKSLGKYVLRVNSHSHSQKVKNERIKELMNIWINTIFRLDDSLFNKSLYLKKTIDHFVPYLEQNEESSKVKKIYLFDKLEILKIKKTNTLVMIYLFGCKILKIKNS